MTQINKESIKLVLGSFIAIGLTWWILISMGCGLLPKECVKGYWKLDYERSDEQSGRYKHFERHESWHCDE